MTRPYIRVPILNDEHAVYVTWGEPEQIRELLGKRGYGDAELLTDDAWDSVQGTCAVQESRPPVICLPEPPSLGARALGVVAHEACHAVNQIFRNIRTEQMDEEVYAHSVGAIVRAAVKYAKKCKEGRG